jgi:metal-dependent amidase/aminoacylase/carboxypeptidase family protein
MSAAKDTVTQAVDGLAEELEALSRRIHDHPELAPPTAAM